MRAYVVTANVKWGAKPLAEAAREVLETFGLSAEVVSTRTVLPTERDDLIIYLSPPREGQASQGAAG
jgi:hypothetical protein